MNPFSRTAGRKTHLRASAKVAPLVNPSAQAPAPSVAYYALSAGSTDVATPRERGGGNQGEGPLSPIPEGASGKGFGAVRRTSSKPVTPRNLRLLKSPTDSTTEAVPANPSKACAIL